MGLIFKTLLTEISGVWAYTCALAAATASGYMLLVELKRLLI